MKTGVCAALLGALSLSACDADVVSVGAWAGGKDQDRKKVDASSEEFDATPALTSDGSVTSLADAAPQLVDATPVTPLLPAGPYIEAELGELNAGFAVGMDDKASDGKFITALENAPSRDAPGDARARYLLDVLSDGNYILWGRIHGPDSNHNRFWFQIDGGPWVLWRMSTGEAWFWDDLHDDLSYRMPITFSLKQGVHELLLANATDRVELDRIYFTSAGDEPPGNDTPCRPPDTIEIGGKCVPSCGSLKGTTCDAALCSGATLLEAYDCKVCCRP